MDQLIDNPVSLALGWTLLHFFWQGCLIALLAKLLLIALHKASSNARYIIACTAFAAMALAPCLTFFTLRQQASSVDQLSLDAGELPATAAKTSTGDDRVPHVPGETEPRASIAGAAKSIAKSGPLDHLDHASATVVPPTALANVGASLRPLLPWFVVVWFGGVCLLSLRLILSWRKLRRLKTTGLHKVSGYQERVLKELCDALGVRRVVQIAHSALVEVPTLVGWLQPIVLLPMSAMSGLDQSQLRALLAHELAHVRRADFAVNLLQTVIETLLFYHPAVWWLSARIRQERENCCDDLAVAECRDGRLYVEALLRMEQLRSVAAPLAISARGGSLTQRATRLLQPNSAYRSAGLQPPVGAAFFSLLLLAMAAITVTSVLPSGETEAAEPTKQDATVAGEWKDGEVMPEKIIHEVPENVLTHTINIVGQARNADGKPIAGATIYVASHEEIHKLLKTTTTDKNGKYAFRDLKLPLEKADGASSDDWGRFEVYGTSDGYAFAWRGQKGYCPDMHGNTLMDRDSPDQPGHFEGDERIRLDLEFARPAPLSGTIVDENGNPIPKTKVHLFNCWRAPTEKFTDSDMFQVDMSSLYSSDYCPPKVSTVVTNDKGEFVFQNAPPECRYRISVKPPGFASRMMYATTESDGPAQSKGSVLERDGMQLVFESPRNVQIKLVGLAKPEHGDGAFVNPHNKSAGGTAISDKNGVATMKIPPGEYQVSILPPINTPYWKGSSGDSKIPDARITVTNEQDQSFELEMVPAAVVDVQVVDESGDPVEGAEGFDLWVENEFNGQKQRDIHYFRNYERETRICHVHRVRTDAKGEMRANFLPGKYRIGVGKDSLPDGWRVVDSKGKEVDLKVGEPTKVAFRVRPPDNGDF